MSEGDLERLSQDIDDAVEVEQAGQPVTPEETPQTEVHVDGIQEGMRHAVQYTTPAPFTGEITDFTVREIHDDGTPVLPEPIQPAPTPVVTQIDVSQLPDNVSLQDVRDMVSTLGNTGVSFDASNDWSTSTDGWTASGVGGTDAVNTGATATVRYMAVPDPGVPEGYRVVPEDEVPRVAQPMTTDEVFESTRVINKSKISRAKTRSKYEKAKANGVRSYVIQNTDLVLMKTIGGQITLFKHDTLRTEDTFGKLYSLWQENGDDDEEEDIWYPLLNSHIMFDKNMNPLTLAHEDSYEKPQKLFPRIHYDNISEDSLADDRTLDYNKWIVVDKEKFLRSKGTDFSPKWREGFTPVEALEIKRYFVSMFKEIEEFIDYMKKIIGGIYDEENYEIVYNAVPHRKNAFSIYVQFPDLTVSNSIEIEHTVHNLITRMDGYHNTEFTGKGDKNRMAIRRSLDGVRTSFNIKDAKFGYSHSHLRTNMFGWNTFCMGSEHFMSHIPDTSMSELEFESLMIGMFDHVSWESLEGGPFYKMETIGLTSSSLVNWNREYSIRTYDQTTVIAIMEEVRKTDISKLKDAFHLVPSSNGNLTYQLDEQWFFSIFVDLFDIVTIEDLHIVGDDVYNPYSYDKERNQFFSERRGGSAGDRAAQLESSRNKVSKIPPIYMNGKYVKPKVVETDEKEEEKREENNRTLCFSPNVIIHIASIIQYHLINDLRNVKK